VPAAELANYFSELERKGISLNFGTYYGSAQARVAVMGNVAGTPSPAQTEKMKALVDEAMRGGGRRHCHRADLSAGQFPEHGGISSSSPGWPRSTTASMRATCAMRARTCCRAIGESIEIGEKAGIQVEVFHFKGAYAPGWGKLVPQAGTLIESARARGVSIAADMYLYAAGGTGLDITVPNWVFEKGDKQALALLKKPKVRERLKKEVAAGSLPGWSNLVAGLGRVGSRGARQRRESGGSTSIATRVSRRSGASLAAIRRIVAWDIVLRAQPKRAMALSS